MRKYFFYLANLLSFLSINSISIHRWEQIHNFSNNDHQNVQTNIEICAQDLQSGKYYTQWGLNFDQKQKIKITNVQLDDKSTNFSFDENQLLIDIGKLYNQQKAKIKINYDLKYEKSYRKLKFAKRDCISVPEYVKGAEVKLIVKIPKDFVVYSNLNFLKKNSNGSLTWNGILKNRIEEEIGICLKKASWDLNTIVSVFSDNYLNNLRLNTDLLYKGANNEVKNFAVFFNGKKVGYKIENNHIVVRSKTSNSCFQKYEFKSQVNNYCGPYKFDNSLIDNEDFCENETIDFNKVVKQILSEDKSKVPAYVKVCRWVNKFLQYDVEMAGKKISAESIFIKRKGVCEHYAILFKRLIQELKIPCYVVSGVAYSSTDVNFIPHAWNVIFWNGKWVPLDPTWNISSGVVPISHIFSKINLDRRRSGIEAKIEFKNEQKETKITMNITQRAEFNPTLLK